VDDELAILRDDLVQINDVLVRFLCRVVFPNRIFDTSNAKHVYCPFFPNYFTLRHSGPITWW